MAKLTQEDFPLTLTHTVEETLHNHFSLVEQALKHFHEYTGRHRTLDYSLMHRFLHTTYKTLHDLDSEFMEQKLHRLYSNLEKVAKIYEDFKAKSKQSIYAYSRIFLSQQEHFNEYEARLFHNSEEISYLRMQSERFKEAVLEQQKAVQNSSLLSSDRHKEEEELKRLKRHENNVIVRFGELVDQNALLFDVIEAFKKRYEEEFTTAFSNYTHAIEPRLKYILDALAFEFDIQLWHKSKESSIIQNYFKNAYTGNVVNSRTYLEYYLRNLDKNKLSAENRALQELLTMLKSTTSLKILVYMVNSEDLFVYKSAFESDGAGHSVNIYTQAKPALSAALSCDVDIIILDASLQKSIIESFMRTFKEHTQMCEKRVYFVFVSNDVNEESLAYAQELGADSLIERELDATEILDAVYNLIQP